MENKEIDESFGTKLLNLLKTVLDNEYVQCPCRVTAINGNYVDVLPIINDDEVNQELYDVKIRHLESSTAYIFLGVHVGDRGVLRFFDRSIENYSVDGSENYNNDDRMHDANDGCFELGFIPDNEAYVYPTDKEIEIGLKNAKFKLSVDENGNLDITSTTTITITAPTINTNGTLNHTGDINATGEITGNSIPLSTHLHSGVTGGNDKTGQPTT